MFARGKNLTERTLPKFTGLESATGVTSCPYVNTHRVFDCFLAPAQWNMKIGHGNKSVQHACSNEGISRQVMKLPPRLSRQALQSWAILSVLQGVPIA
jgi:hypothetical protein